MKLIHIVGARPNFMKLAPLYNCLKKYNVVQYIIHTGQHYSNNMSDVFFSDLEIDTPHFNLNIGSGSHAEQVAKIMLAFEPIAQDLKPDVLVVYGDVNSTLATALVCVKMGIPIAHVEAGLRSFDREMPEEINRILTDRISSLLFTPSIDGNENLIKEGVDKDNIFLVGNIMIDTLIKFLNKQSNWEHTATKNPFALVTLHRPSNVDNENTLKNMMAILAEISEQIPLLFPIHPRTKNKLQEYNITLAKNIYLTEPLGYIDFLHIMKKSKFIITDSGGVQEESSFLGIPCLTMRKNTERPITINLGTNVLVGDDFDLLKTYVSRILSNQFKQKQDIPLWDGKTSDRIAEILNSIFNKAKNK
jgi:UDP-N-acetylglucosamine 2-epimerase (non-hydrolysing)